MDVVVDANVVADYYREDVLGHESSLTSSSRPLFDALGAAHRMYLDGGGQIEHEYRNHTDELWLDGWLGTALINGGASQVETRPSRALEKRLHERGFPRSRDVHYVRTAVAVTVESGGCDLVSEDVHFFDPKAKTQGAERRRQILLMGDGPISQLLSDVGIRVVCVCSAVS